MVTAIWLEFIHFKESGILRKAFYSGLLQQLHYMKYAIGIVPLALPQQGLTVMIHLFFNNQTKFLLTLHPA